MASGRQATVTVTPQPLEGSFNAIQLQRAKWSGGSGSVSHDDQPSPERGVGSNVPDFLRMQTTGTLNHESPLIFLDQWHSVMAALRSTYLASVAAAVIGDVTIAFDAVGNRITTLTAGLFAPFAGMEGFPLFIKGAATAGNNSGPEKLGVIVSVADEEIVLDAAMMPLTTEAAGAAVSVSAGFPIKNGSRSPLELYRQYEVAMPDTIARAVTSDAIAVAGPEDLIAPQTLTGPAGTFSSFLDAPSGYALNIFKADDPAWVNNTPVEANPATLEAVAPDGSSITVGNFDLTTEAAGAEIVVALGGSYAQLYDMLLESLAINYEGGGLISTTATYQVSGFLDESDRSRGVSAPLPPLGDGQPLALGRMVESAYVGGVWFVAKTLDGAQVQIATNLEYGNALGAAGRADPESTHVSVSGSFTMKHDRRYLQPLATQQADPDHSMPAYIVIKDTLGNRIALALPKIKLKDAFPDVGSGRVMWNPNWNAMYSPTFGATIGWSWVPAF